MFERKIETSKYSRQANYKVKGFWSDNSISIYQFLHLNNPGYYAMPKINWSSGGRDDSEEPNNIRAAENFGNAILDAVKLADEWDKDTGKEIVS